MLNFLYNPDGHSVRHYTHARVHPYPRHPPEQKGNTESGPAQRENTGRTYNEHTPFVAHTARFVAMW